MPLKIIRHDITRVRADVIVNSAHTKPIVGTGTDRAIYKAAGLTKILAERIRIGVIKYGEIGVTSAGKLKAKRIIHVAGPKWDGGKSGEIKLLESCYRKALYKADKLGYKSIAFPVISAGVFGFPKRKSINIAIDTFNKFLEKHEMDITFVIFDSESYSIAKELFGEIDSYIDDDYVENGHLEEYGVKTKYIPEHTVKEGEEFLKSALNLFDGKGNHLVTPDDVFKKNTTKELDLDDILETKDETYQDMLMNLIDKSGKKDPEIYKKANLDKNTFSKIRGGSDYTPKMKNLVGFAFALELDIDTTQALLNKAGYSLSRSKGFDKIVMYYLERKEYDVHKVNMVLYEKDEEQIGTIKEKNN